MPATVVAVANQKGDVANTPTTLSLRAAMAERRLAALVVDLDPQADLTCSLGHDPDSLDPSMSDVLAGRSPLANTIRTHAETDLAPANIDLAGAEITLLTRTGREYVLRSELDTLRDSYDAILIDCPPSLGVLTLNALTAADRVLIPVQCETLSHRGVSQLLETIVDIQRLTNRELQIAGFVATMFDGRTRHSREVLEDVQTRYGLRLIGAPVRKSVRFAEAPVAGRSILASGTQPRGADAYRIIAAELAGLDVDPVWRERAGATG